MEFSQIKNYEKTMNTMSRDKILELLAPAGSMEALKAGVNAGADAVYLSGKNFGARQFADNFTTTDMEKALEYCHLRGVKVYVTVNTLIKEDELIKVAEHLSNLYSLGVDAVIIQDVGVACIARDIVPELPLHGSTQMTVHNPEGVRWAGEHGFRRVVLSREMGLNDIKKTAQMLDESKHQMELEVFAHGALCYSYSGQCLLSSFIGGRSGNRGMCAQPCRKPYQLLHGEQDQHGKPINTTRIPLKEHYLLSTKDLGVYKNLDKIYQSPVDSIKIEGRMRSPEYVAIVVGVYRKSLDSLSSGKWKAEEEEFSKLKMVFNRGLTPGYLLNSGFKKVMGRNSPGNRGLYLGKVIDFSKSGVRYDKEVLISLKSKIKPEKGDGFLFLAPHLNLKDYDDIDEAGADDLWGTILEYTPPVENGLLSLKIRKNVKIGSRVYITRKKSLLDAATKLTSDPQLPSPIPLDLKLNWNQELVPIIEVEANPQRLNKINLTLNADFSMEKAIKKPLSPDTITKHLKKTGGTPFIVKKIEMDYPGNLFTPISNLNRLRRNMLDEVKNKMLKSQKPSREEFKGPKKKLSSFKKEMSLEIRENFKPKRTVHPILSVYVDRISSVKAAIEAGCRKIYFQPSMSYHENYSKYTCWEKHGDGKPREHGLKEYFDYLYDILIHAASLDNDSDSNIIWKWPEITDRSYIKNATPLLESLFTDGASGVMVNGLGAAWAVQNQGMDINIFGASGVNVWNHLTVEEIAGTFKSITLSPELSRKELRRLVGYSKISSPNVEFEVLVQGNIETLVSEDCLRCIVDRKTHLESANEFLGIKDAKNRLFPIRTDDECRTHVLNSVELCLIDYLPSILEMGMDGLVIDARMKTPRYVKDMLSFYGDGLEKTILNNPNLKNELLYLKKKVKKISNGGITTGNFLRGVAESEI